MCELHLKELRHLIKLSFLAVEELEYSVKHITDDFERRMDLAWHHINGLLIYTARVSKILWGTDSSKRSKQRAEDIRKHLSVPKDSIFHYQYRRVRNYFDHIDEKIDDIEDGVLKIGSLDLNIGNINTMIGNKGVGDYMRHYDPDSRTIYFGESNIPIPDLMDELRRLKEQVDKCL